MKFPLLISSLSMVLLFSCKKEPRGYDEGGGQLPGQYFIIKNRSISPNTVSISSGNNLIFSNQSNEVHHVLSTDSVINSEPIQPWRYYMWTKDIDGIFTVRCVYHPEESATITLNP